MAVDKARRPHTSNAVVLIPGIGGSALKDPETQTMVWGGSTRQLAKTLIRGTTFDELALDRPLEPTGLLEWNSFIPTFGRLEPYGALAAKLAGFCVHSDGFAAFAYDWRQPLAITSARFAEFAANHLHTWRKQFPDAKLSVVAHSMGGLVATHAASTLLDSGDLRRDDIDVIATLGTPFGGSVKAIKAINDGAVVPRGVHQAKVVELLATLPSVHDLLPTYPALTSDPNQPDNAQVPTVDDLVAIGANGDLVRQSRETLEAIDLAEASDKLVCLMGSVQPTLQSYTETAGHAACHLIINNQDWGGDGTVYTGAAYPRGHQAAHSLPQQHGAIANSDEAITWSTTTLAHRTLGPPMGMGLGLHAPDTTVVGDEIDITITYDDPDKPHGDPSVAICDSNNDEHSTPRLYPTATGLHTTIKLTKPDLYTIILTGGGQSSIRANTLALPTEP